MLVVTGSVTARPDSFEALRQAALDHVYRSRAEPGCLTHSVQVDCENPLRLVFCGDDQVIALEEFAEDLSGDFLRDSSGRIAWFRWGSRIRPRVS